MNLQGFKMQSVRRCATHLCAREALGLEADVSSFSVTPVYLIDSIQSDLYPQNVE